MDFKIVVAIKKTSLFDWPNYIKGVCEINTTTLLLYHNRGLNNGIIQKTGERLGVSDKLL